MTDERYRVTRFSQGYTSNGHRYPSLYLIVSTTTSWASRPMPYQAAIDRCQQLNDGTATPQKGPELHATPANR